jgi:hypothetical protein
MEVSQSENICKNIILDLIAEFCVKKKYQFDGFVDYCNIVAIKKFDDFKINLINTCNQNGGALCGFHCLFNIIHFLDFLESDKHNDKLVSLKKMSSPVKFWKFYNKTVKYLVNNLKMEQNAKESLLNKGPLERYQFKFLLEKCDKLQKNTKLKFFRFFFGFGIIQGMNKSELKTLQQNLENLKANKDNMTYVILLGITNHWVKLY